MNKAFNKADLSGAVVVGKALQYPRRVNVLIGNDNNGYERGDLADTNAVIDIINCVIDCSDHKELKPIKEALQKEIQDRRVEDISLTKSILNTTVNVIKTTMPNEIVYTIKQGDRVVGIINVPNNHASIVSDTSNIQYLDQSASQQDIVNKINLLIDKLQNNERIIENPES